MPWQTSAIDWIASTSSATTSSWYSSIYSATSATTTNSAFNQYVYQQQLQVLQAQQQRNAMASLEQQLAGRMMEQMQGLGRLGNPPTTKRAQLRARSLLRMVLTAAQWQSFLERKMFEIEGRSGQLYRIHHGRIANIEVPRLGHRLCVHPDPGVPMPVEDVLVSQVLHLRDDDLALVRRANIHPGLGQPRS